MKQSYMKPLFSLEMLTVTQSVARDCSDSIPIDQVSLSDINKCFWDLGGMKVFLEEPICDINGEEMGIACYNNPSEGNYIFRS